MYYDICNDGIIFKERNIFTIKALIFFEHKNNFTKCFVCVEITKLREFPTQISQDMISKTTSNICKIAQGSTWKNFIFVFLYFLK